MNKHDKEKAIGILQEANESFPAGIDWKKLLEKISEFVTYLQASEELLILAIERAQHQKPSYPAPTSGGAEFGWLPYLFKHANDKDSDDPLIVAFQKRLEEVFGSYTDVLEKFIHVIGMIIDPKIEKKQWQFLEENMDKSNIIANDGTIVGTNKFEDLDTGWLYVPANYLYNLAFPAGIAAFIPPAPAKPFNGKIGGTASTIKVAIIGDWGTGDYEASEHYEPAAGVMQAVQNLDPDYVIHLGDVYYCGTDLRLPPGEEAANLLAHWPAEFSGKSFTLNSNHEMYGGAQGYFEIALNRASPGKSPFNVQNGFSYFALEFGSWVLVGLDAAYHDTSSLYMQGGIGTIDELPKHPQLTFLTDIAKQYGDKKIILLSHQTGMSTDGTTTDDYPLLSQIQATGLKPDYWYWGHIHLGLVYGMKSAVTTASGGTIKARCVGHSAVPFGTPWGLKTGGEVIDFIADDPVAGSPLAKNGLAMLTLTNDGKITEQFFNGVPVGSGEKPSPVWTGTADA